MRVGTAAETDSEKVGTMREGKLDQKHLLFGEDGSPNNYDLNTGSDRRWWLAHSAPPAQLRPDPVRHQGSAALHRDGRAGGRLGGRTSPRASTTAPRSGPRVFGPWSCSAAAPAVPAT